ncbi:hypothetical protein ACSLOE_30580, partial [Escherichia coli]
MKGGAFGGERWSFWGCNPQKKGVAKKKPIKTMRCNKAELQVSNTPPPTLWKPSIHAGSAHITCRKTV